ncbi:hypothetical protein DPMN_106051 [Dreissena polymorpha]|uniref:Uncharacterized protein n=1 Tax=Dreissena polymorpha TaxID=45954 RepID=A0A9D4QID6_DREPO|nr:hypothetical protein DPMN_106051 [Dreissena polymorpha]
MSRRPPASVISETLEPAQEASSTETGFVQLGAISVPPGTDSRVPETPEPLLEATSSSTGGTFVPPSMGLTTEQVVPTPLPVGATYVPPPFEETVVGEVPGPWMSLLAEPLSVTPTVSAV